MVGELSPTLSSRVRRLRGRAGKAAPPVRVLRASTRTTAHNPHDLAPREKAPPRRQDQLDDDETTKEPPRSSPKTKRPRPGVLPALISLGSNPSLLPVYCSAHLPAPAGSFQKRGVPSRPPPRALRGGRGKSFLAQVQGNHSPKKRPLLYMTFDL